MDRSWTEKMHLSFDETIKEKLPVAKLISNKGSSLENMMISQITDLANKSSNRSLNSTTIQNWVKRSIIGRPLGKKYDMDQVASILLVHDLRDVISLDDAKILLEYINGDPNTSEDDLIPPRQMFEYYASIFDNTKDACREEIDRLYKKVASFVGKRTDLGEEGRERVVASLMILEIAVRASLYKMLAEDCIKRISLKESPT